VRLRQYGVASVEDLAAVEALDLARAMEVGVTRVMRLQFLARRFLDAARADEQLTDTTVLPASPNRSLSAGWAQRFSPSETAFTPRPTEIELELPRYAPGAGEPDSASS